MAISIITIDGESYDVGASAGNVAFNNSGTGISAGTVQGAIEEISATGGGGYEPPVGGIPKTDLASDVQTSLGKADTALQSESDPVFTASAAYGITSTDINNWNNKANSAAIPTKTSDLTNDSGFVTDEDIEDFVTAESIEEIVMGSADVMVVETPGYIDIVFATASITFSPDTTMSLYASQKTGTLTVSGTHLKQDITLTVPSGFTAQVSGGTAAQSITIPQTGGEVTGVSVTITYTGADSGSYNGSITATSGSTTASVGLVYSQYQGATIIAGTIGTIKAAMGGSQIGELNVSGVNLEDDISASVGNGDFTICATQNGTYGTTATISKASAEASGGATLFVKYTPSSGTSTASGTLTLKTPRNGVLLSKTVTLTGAVAGTLSISPASASIGIASGGSGTEQFTVTGANLTPASTASVAVSGTGMSADKQTLTVGQDGTINEVVTVTFSGSADSNGTLTISHADVDDDATAAVVGSVVAPLPVDAAFKVNGIFYKVNSDQASVRVWNGTSESSEASSTNKYKNAITIPASVSDADVTATLSDSTTQAGAGFTYAVTELANRAFQGCTGLTSLTLPEGLTHIGLLAIYQCTNDSFTSLTIPSTVISIGSNFLSSCTKLTTVNMLCAKNTNFVDSWGAQYNPQLKDCSALTSFVQPDNITVGRPDNYQGCSAMQSFTIGKSCTVINRMFSANYMPNVTEIICRGTTTIPKINASSSTTFVIDSTVFANATLKVPRGYKQAYLDAVDGRSGTTLWSGFATIEEYDLTD